MGPDVGHGLAVRVSSYNICEQECLWKQLSFNRSVVTFFLLANDSMGKGETKGGV